jgi:hypothetical protein
MAASQDRFPSARAVDVETKTSHPVAAATKVYQGTFVGRIAATGYARPLVANDTFIGVSSEQIDNTSGAAGDQRVPVRRGMCILHEVTGVTGIVDETKLVYATDDQTLSLTPNNSPVGVIEEYVTGTKCFVRTFTAAELAAL